MRQNHVKSNIVILAFESAVEMSITVIRDMFAAAQRAADNDRTSIVVASQDGKPVRTFSGADLAVDACIEDIPTAEMVIVSGVWADESDFLRAHKRAREWLVAQYEGGAIIGCMHTAAFLLAEAGLLDHQPATVFWRVADEFRRRYPKVILRAEKRITTTDRIVCTSGIRSGIELAMILIERFYGARVADTVARNFLMDIEHDAPPALVGLRPFRQHDDAQILGVQNWMEWNYASDFLLEEVAERAGLSLRSFTRRFQKVTGTTALHYLQRVRVEVSKQLLKSEALTVDEVARRVGYGDATHFSRVFKKLSHVSPGDYKRSH